jgi:ubiquinone biosynthesis protein COQ9
LIPTYGFSRQTLAVAALHLPRPHSEPLSDGAITALFGAGNEARKNLAWAWLEEGRRRMKGPEDATENTQRMAIPIEVSLRRRLQWNVPLLDKLPEVGRARRQ